ncbi:MAG: hypothetical protein MJ229_01835 [bacterium]|nr:hypothetical protein [bacterium]
MQEIIKKINLDIENFENKTENCQVDLYMCRFTLFQFFQLKYLENRNREYIGYLMNYVCQENKETGEIKKVYSLDNSYISTLNRANILEEVKQFRYDEELNTWFENDIKYDEYFFELINQYYSENDIKRYFLEIIESEKINIETESKSNIELFNVIKENNIKIFYSYYRKINKNGSFGKKPMINTKNRHFVFRYFKLSEEYMKYEKELWDALKEEFGWRLKYKISRKL